MSEPRSAAWGRVRVLGFGVRAAVLGVHGVLSQVACASLILVYSGEPVADLGVGKSTLPFRLFEELATLGEMS